MDLQQLPGYGLAFSDLESLWSPELKAEMRRKGMAVVMRHLGLWERLRFGLAFLQARGRARRLDLSDLRARGMNNEPFLAQQLEYLALFAALARIKGTQETIVIMKELMDETAREPLLLCLPPQDAVRAAGDPFEVFRHYFRAAPAAACAAGCNEIALSQDDDQAIQMDITWCVWLELARKMGVPEACLPNCYSDDLVFPDYFQALGIRYRRTGSLAGGQRCCDFRFEHEPRGA